ncbi:MAG TPA: hypothetical protein VLT36_21415 [Candidatus Dormibacteraeota bacterium]|nr:hypothetical protein [Candidatus Dormibacteraeota bacterium]
MDKWIDGLVGKNPSGHPSMRSFVEPLSVRNVPLLRRLGVFGTCLATKMALLAELGPWQRGRIVVLLCAVFSVGSGLCAPIPPPEQLLPDDTLFVLTAPDFPRLRKIFQDTPYSQLWDDPAMKPFKDNFLAKWNEEFVKPLERELGTRLGDYTSLAQGQVTFAMIPQAPETRNGRSTGMVLLVDTKGKAAQIKSNIRNLSRKWSDSGRALRTQKLRDFEFTILPLSSNELPAMVMQFFPQAPQVQELGPDGEPKKNEVPKSELVIGQANTLLVIANSSKVAEKVLVRLTGGGLPALADQAAFQTDYLALFRDAPVYAWLNAKQFVDALAKKNSETVEPAVPDAMAGPKPEQVLAAAGIAGIRSLAVAAQSSNEGLFVQGFLNVPESARQGLCKVLAGEAKESSPPAFVPGDAVRFRRWRLDGQKTWGNLEKMLTQISPQALSGLNFVIETAGARAKEKDPSFDLKKSLLANLGDDIITYEKAPRGTTLEEIDSPPSICLLSSPHPEELVSALKALFIIFPGADAAIEREFLGRKILATPAPSIPLPLADPSRSSLPRTLSYAASAGYVALSTDAETLEQYLRSSDGQGKTLRETPGLTEAAQKVTGPDTDLFGFNNQAETMRSSFEAYRNNAGSATNMPSSGFSPLPGAFGLSSPDRNIKEYMDFSLLPGFDKVSRYYHFTVYGAGANVDGLTFKWFAPTPPALRGASAAASTAAR